MSCHRGRAARKFAYRNRAKSGRTSDNQPKAGRKDLKQVNAKNKSKAYIGFVVGKVPRREGSGQHALTKSNDKVHNPQPAKKVKNLHAKQVSEKKSNKTFNTRTRQ